MITTSHNYAVPLLRVGSSSRCALTAYASAPARRILMDAWEGEAVTERSFSLAGRTLKAAWREAFGEARRWAKRSGK